MRFAEMSPEEAIIKLLETVVVISGIWFLLVLLIGAAIVWLRKKH